jgi:hypothetical protein
MKVAITFVLLFAFYYAALVTAQFQITSTSRGLKKRGKEGAGGVLKNSNKKEGAGGVLKKSQKGGGEGGPTFTMITLEADKEDPTQIVTFTTTSVPSDPVMAAGPCALIGGAPIKMIEELCKKVKHGDSSFDATLYMPDYVTGLVPVTLSLADTYGCDLPEAPAGVKAKFTFSGVADYLIWCEPDAIERERCGIWLYTQAVTDYWNKVHGTPASVVTDQVEPPVPDIRHLTQKCVDILKAADQDCGKACARAGTSECEKELLLDKCVKLSKKKFFECERKCEKGGV